MERNPFIHYRSLSFAILTHSGFFHGQLWPLSVFNVTVPISNRVCVSVEVIDQFPNVNVVVIT